MTTTSTHGLPAGKGGGTDPGTGPAPGTDPGPAVVPDNSTDSGARPAPGPRPAPDSRPAPGGRVPFFPPDLFHEDRETLLRLLHEIGTGADQKFILGDRTRRFEDALRDRLGAADVVACSSGTSALHLILTALGVGPGDEVVVPALGCAPLAAAVLHTGAVPVFGDVDPRTLTLDPEDARARVTPRTKALVPAHMFSVMADMPRFTALAAAEGLRLVEDSAVAQGAVLDGTPAGLWGDAGLYSFVQVKAFGMPGEGGAVVTRDEETGRRVRMLRNHGQDGVHRGLHHVIGVNSRFDEIQAAFQLHRLPGLDARLERRARIAAHYTEHLTGLPGLTTPPPGTDGRCHYVYTLLADDRDALRDHLAAEGVDTHVYYPAALPDQAAFAPVAAGRAGPGWPRARDAARRQLSLPVHHRLTDAQVEHVTAAVRAHAPRARA
ncbi:DegT/DnrJ/EryC1/StrS aminotransferase family protein [Streptomyces sp. WAC08241]|uniref:DegT/DnrJ/EryC1/StrS family aminotransferase n=1 Tax=Streptomyces sp. WAC08241 TaxID=2487421 RepID=UPI000F78C30F|nr:DegT/DnrJ/EryC1/StrS family aminotransferase [Streptomyces sp. WAC08241]RSS38044.1 DegT/DnrJ/EryC1/StrS family aminotransferase [Streptomyces sp. WAC08241]